MRNVLHTYIEWRMRILAWWYTLGTLFLWPVSLNYFQVLARMYTDATSLSASATIPSRIPIMFNNFDYG